MVLYAQLHLCRTLGWTLHHSALVTNADVWSHVRYWLEHTIARRNRKKDVKPNFFITAWRAALHQPETYVEANLIADDEWILENELLVIQIHPLRRELGHRPYVPMLFRESQLEESLVIAVPQSSSSSSLPNIHEQLANEERKLQGMMEGQHQHYSQNRRSFWDIHPSHLPQTERDLERVPPPPLNYRCHKCQGHHWRRLCGVTDRNASNGSNNRGQRRFPSGVGIDQFRTAQTPEEQSNAYVAQDGTLWVLRSDSHLALGCR